MNFEELEQKVITWAYARGILPDYDPQASRVKLGKSVEEIGEVWHAELRNDMPGIYDALGDVLVTLIVYSFLRTGKSLVEHLAGAYSIISKRSGQVVNGTFIREPTAEDPARAKG